MMSAPTPEPVGEEAPPTEEEVAPTAPTEGGDPPAEALEPLAEASQILVGADQYEFASPEYTAEVQKAMPLLQEGRTALEEAGGAEQWPELMKQVDTTIAGCSVFLDVDWGDPDTVATEGATDAPSAEAEAAGEAQKSGGGAKSVPPKEPALTAGARALKVVKEPPAAWFADPKLKQPTPLTITDDGRIYGHLALWGTCHTGYQGECVSPPNSASGYGYFRTGSVVTADGTEVAVGHITMDTLHAAAKLGPTDTLSHYEHTGATAADIAAGDDDHGIWIAGALRPGLPPDKVRSLRASPLSGDWRRIAGNLELVAALAVNVPGFPVPRPAGLVAGGTMQSLVASGMVPPTQVIPPGQPGALSVEDLRYLKQLAHREKTQTNEAAATLARKVRAGSLAAKVRRH
jgi:hypothetical protein